MRRFPAELLRVMLRKLAQLDAATVLQDLRAPPAQPPVEPTALDTIPEILQIAVRVIAHTDGQAFVPDSAESALPLPKWPE